MKFTAKIKKWNQITVPKDIVEMYDINRTDFVEFEVTGVKKK